MKRRRPPPELRAEVDFGYRIRGHSVELFEIRPDWKDKTTLVERPFAKATWVSTIERWRVFWNRADLRWHGYQPHSEVRTLAEFPDLVEQDEHGSFFG